ncbi:crotonobetainyl-CoA:carnitine CoA-transferase CaiB-like acyl-CoA transferase [Cytobacillus oceanisediminis]|jgi:formyl-CoA transferase|uniref:Crotonobetainyl-CoA:carnitine CoA-transferase CaiB-like acyl-CoA transferase n=1 Tax=Cytobacillus oceanisediminis TaxID=665099 RepID=A0A2V3AAU3_9BACI|nr:CoA transferase [Cytobacillus oceanisediminis]PWW32374.1 crotonobetainyl-CoA:carnitine CoA-transferase CaiB-like acyl-CoA transferase [Cytobacillus oceanisediminis]
MNKKPLEGIKVVELGAFIAGPFASRLLGEFGAEVIKVESPKGDQLRTWGPHAPGQDSYWSMIQSRNKRSISVDMRTFDGQEIVRELIKEADVVLENFKPGTLLKWRLSHEEMKELNPKLIITSITGFGQTGPYRDLPGFGNIAESMGGLRYVTGYPDRPPVRVGLAIGDSLAGLYAVIGTLLSLYNRDIQFEVTERKGQVVDVALYEAVFSLLDSIVTEYVHEGIVRERTGNQHVATAPSNVYQTKDGKYVAIGANSDSLFKRLTAAMGREDLANNPKLQNNAGRAKEADLIDEAVENWTRQYNLDEVMKQLNAVSVPGGPIYNVEDIVKDTHYQARDMIIAIPDERIGEIVMQGVVPKLSETPGEVKWAGPECGAHTEEVLSSIGYTADKIKELKSKNIIKNYSRTQSLNQ